MKLKHCFQRAAAVMACLMLFCNVASAAEPARPSYKELTEDQLKRECSLTLTYKEGDTVLPQTTFTLYKVADIDGQLQFKLTNTFGDEGKKDIFNKINERGFNDWSTLASTIGGYLGGANSVTERSDANGVLSFTGLETGLYYLTGEVTGGAPGTYRYTPTPVMLVLPSWNGADWDFDADGMGKFRQEYVQVPVVPTPTVSRRVLKVWNDAGYENRRPESVQVQLIGNGEVYDTATMTADSRWAAVQWDGLDANVNWQVAEVLNSTRYTPSIVRDDTTGITFVITNTYNPPDGGDPDGPDEPGGGGGGTEVPDPEVPTTDIDDPDTPRTDNPGLPDDPGVPEEPVEEIEDPDVPLADLPNLPQTGQLWWPVPLLAVGGVAMILTGLIRRRDGSCDQ